MAYTYRELLHQAVDELIDEHFIKMLYKIAACNIRKEAIAELKRIRKVITDIVNKTDNELYLQKIYTYVNRFYEKESEGRVKTMSEHITEDTEYKKPELGKRRMIEMVEGIENRQHLEMIYGFVSGFYRMEVKDSEPDSQGL
ncbi:MAG: hypothetical protein K2M60_10865 [Lachnospiraceae bacterium]|nr:hypothetical protein [Lachnospiraceae bacterium]MDE6251773.1 hypothetical protein [Lachnospiraceae bacterium]